MPRYLIERAPGPHQVAHVIREGLDDSCQHIIDDDDDDDDDAGGGGGGGGGGGDGDGCGHGDSDGDSRTSLHIQTTSTRIIIAVKQSLFQP